MSALDNDQTQAPDTVGTAPAPLAIVSLVAGVLALVLTFTLTRADAGWAMAAAVAAVITGALSRGRNGVWLARAGILAGVAAGILLAIWFAQ